MIRCSMHVLGIVIVLIGCRTAPVPRPTERETQLELELTKTRAALRRAEAVIAVQRQAARPRGDTKVVDVPVEQHALPADCHAYKAGIEKLLSCDKMAASSAAMREAFEDAWEQMKSLPPDGRAALAEGCKVGLEAIESSFKAMGC